MSSAEQEGEYPRTALSNYVIFFRVLDGMVRVERVLHGARNLPMLFGQDTSSPD